jgi:hypothetical protein
VPSRFVTGKVIGSSCASRDCAKIFGAIAFLYVGKF